MKNKELLLDNTIVPYVVNEEGIEYYPIKYVMEQFLLRRLAPLHTKKEYKNYISRYIIDYSFKGTTPQEANCMSKEGWVQYAENIKFKGFDESQIERHNLWCEYIGCTENIVQETYTIELDEYATDCIKEFEMSSLNVEYCICNKCKNKFPLHTNFFSRYDRNKCGYVQQCRICCNNTISVYSYDNFKTRIYNKFGLEGYLEYKYNQYNFYMKYCHKKNFKFESNSNQYMKIIKEAFNNNIINKDDLIYSRILDIFNFDFSNKTSSHMTTQILNEYCSDYECKIHTWLYKNYKPGIKNINDASNILNNYIKFNNIVIEDPLKYSNWSDIIRHSRLTHFYGDTLGFVVKFNNNKFAGYKYKISASNYYKDKDNCIFDMKWFIENDLKIELTKIPLYVTKYSISRKAKKMYTAMRNNGYYKDLYTWINDCYPGMFIEADFTINPFRSEFDSLEEAQVDEQLKLKLSNVIYNPRNSENTINIFGMIPDWIAITNKGCYLIEYFGMYLDNPGISTISFKYKNKTDKKIEKYISLEKHGYKHLFIFPNDLRNNFDGLNRKLNSILN